MWVMNADGTNRRDVGARHRQPPGRAAVDRRQQRRAVHRAGTRQRPALSRSGARAAASPRSSSTSAARSDRFRRRRTPSPTRWRRRPIRRRCMSPAEKLTDLNASLLARQADRRGRVVHVRVQRQQVRGRGVPDQADRLSRVGEVSVDRQHPRRPARPAGSGVQLQESGLCRARLGDADGQLPRIDRLRPGVRRRRLRGSERQRGPGRAVRRERGAAPLSVDRSRSARRRGHQLRRSTFDVAADADQHLQGGDSHRGDHQHRQLQLHDVLQPVRGDGVGHVSASGQPDGHAAAALGDAPRGATRIRRRC